MILHLKVKNDDALRVSSGIVFQNFGPAIPREEALTFVRTSKFTTQITSLFIAMCINPAIDKLIRKKT